MVLHPSGRSGVWVMPAVSLLAALHFMVLQCAVVLAQFGFSGDLPWQQHLKMIKTDTKSKQQRRNENRGLVKFGFWFNILCVGSLAFGLVQCIFGNSDDDALHEDSIPSM